MVKPTFGLKDKVVLVTGGSRGIGLEIARHLLAEKAKVVICARKQPGLEAAVADLGGGPDVLPIPAHIGRAEEVDRLFETIINQFNRLDILVNNVGMNLLTASTAETEHSVWHKIIDSNLNATYYCSKKAAEVMKPRQCGKIISLSSTAARKASPGMGIYGIAKAGIEMLTRVLASELASFNIQVNAVAPGMVRTEFSRPFWSNESLYQEIVKTIPMGRIAEPADVVYPTLFLASSAADYITGQVLSVDGGSTTL
jgi:NAD(P)-dependent dehydrogenase (short-subunit alcohol dehydrogenase family)